MRQLGTALQNVITDYFSEQKPHNTGRTRNGKGSKIHSWGSEFSPHFLEKEFSK